MPYSPQHKADTRHKIVEAARVLFNRRGFAAVTIDEVMGAAGLTRGGFYNHFSDKEQLYNEAVASFLSGRGKQWRDEAGIDPVNGGAQAVRAMINSYLSAEHADDIDGQCPMIALPSDVARASSATRQSYENLLKAMLWLFQTNLPHTTEDKAQMAQVLAALSVGGMVLARTLDDRALADQIRESARHFALSQLDDPNGDTR